jgi:cytochrome c-type biogenesis protein
VLGAILAVAAGEDSVRQGVSLLFVYSLGLGIPFILAAVAIRPFMSALQRFRGHLAVMEKVLGAFLVLTGILFLTDSMTLIAGWILQTFPSLATIG